MKIKNIGIPRYAYYNKYKEFIKNYFEYLGYNVILSNKYQNKAINSNRCYLYSQYKSHIISLKERCDFVVVPYERNNEKKESICPILENMNTIIKKEISNILTFNIKYKLSIIKETLKINKNIPKIIISYILALLDYHKNKLNQRKIEYEKIINNSPHILLVTYSYFNYEIKNNRYNIIYSKNLSDKIMLDYSKNYPHQIYNIEIKKIIGSIYYCKELVEKIIVINIRNCKYQLKEYVKNLDNEIKRKIIIINI